MSNREELREDLGELVRERIEQLRPRLLDLTRRNPLIYTRFSPRSASFIRVVDELPDNIAERLGNQARLRFVPLPPLTDDPIDEQSSEFQDALSGARLTDEEYLSALAALDPNSDEALDAERQIERALRDRVRVDMGMAPRQESSSTSLQQHAINNGISPHYDLPFPGEEVVNERHGDQNIQTLLLPNDMERKLNALLTKCRTWEQETGVNVLHAAFGFLQWEDPRSRQPNNAPLILLPVKLERVRTRQGAEFLVNSDGDDFEANVVLATQLSRDFGIELPNWNGDPIDVYLKTVEEIAPSTLAWRVRRQVAFGVFPSARMAMYADLGPDRSDFSESPIVTRLLATGSTGDAAPFADEYDIDTPSIEAKVPYLVLDADSSQFSTIVDIADGVSMAVEGPPGTGKSQTIVNTIANAIVQGKKVLFVAEKTAALEVVRSRLEAVGLGEFLLPLQATRSTRQEVIDSIRARLEVRRPSIPAGYQSRVDEFRVVRSDLQAYIDTVSAPLGETELSVHDILGSSMLSGGLLDELPAVLKYPPVGNIESLKPQQRKEAREAADAFAQAWMEAQKTTAHWSGLGVRNINRFSVSQLTDQARAASDALEEEHFARERLRSVSMDTTLNLGRLRQVVTSLEVIGSQLPDLECGLILRICRTGTWPLLVEFLNSCEQYSGLVVELLQVVPAPEAPDAPEHARELLNLCSVHGIEYLDPVVKAKELDAREHLIGSMTKVRGEVKSFVTTFPEVAAVPLIGLAKASALVRATEREVIESRSATTAHPMAVPLIRDLCRTGRRLRVERDLFVANSVAESLSVYELRAHAEAIQSAGPLGRLSPSYRAARRTFKSISGPVDFTNEYAASTLQRLAIWKQEVQEFTEDSQARSTLGLMFRGLDTNFDLLEKLCDFYEQVDREFQSNVLHEVRILLKTGDSRLLFALPNLPPDAPDVTVASLERQIETQEKEIAFQRAIATRVSDISHVLRDGPSTTLSNLEAIATRLEQLGRVGATLDSNEGLKEILGARFDGRNTRPENFQTEVTVLQCLETLDDLLPITLHLIEHSLVHDATRIVSQVIEWADESARAISKLETMSGIPFSNLLQEKSYPEIIEYLREAASHEGSLFIHSALAVARDNVALTGFGWALSALEVDHQLDRFGEILDAVITRAMTMRAFDLHGKILNNYRGAKLDDLRLRLAHLDREIIQLSRKYVRASLAQQSRPPHGVGIGRRSEWTEMALINNEVAKKKRHISARSLTHRAGYALLELKPCWMMSPLAVAQYLPHDLEFDLCIIDEASQMPPEDAIGAVGRSRQVMVVGDTNQLPPTTFFRKLLDEEDEEDEEAILEESILDLANGVFKPSRRLRWHYRSQHPSLIQFSNEYIYNSKLIVFPSPTLERDDMGVSLVPVEGRYHSGVNEPEASEMVRWARQFMRRFPDRSLGLVTLNQKQRDLLIEEWERVLGLDNRAADYVQDWATRKDGLESFFIKNLENVQGDERDVIFVGTVYGPESPGKPVMQRFGPVNGVAGRRRLNVLFTRAKQQVITFSSMTADDIRADENGNPGAFLLKRWLEYAATGHLHGGVPQVSEPDSDFELFVIDQIRSMGCEPVPQVGVRGYRIDIGVKHPHWPHGFIMGIECDGATYHSSRSARDRDRLREEVLRGLGWHLHRIWSTDWFNDPRSETERLRKVIDARLKFLREHELAATDTSWFEDVPDLGSDDERAVQSGIPNPVPGNSATTYPQLSLVTMDETAHIPPRRNSHSRVRNARHKRRVVQHRIDGNAHSDTDENASGGRADHTSQGTFFSSLPDAHTLNPERFYDADYMPSLRTFVCALVDRQGPITFSHLSELTARAHGWQRTGSRIKKQVWAAISAMRHQTRGPDDRVVFWPESTPPQQFVPFRGMVVNGHARQWLDISYPEKLGLAVAVVRSTFVEDPVLAMASRIGLERIRQTTRDELVFFIAKAQAIVSLESASSP